MIELGISIALVLLVYAPIEYLLLAGVVLTSPWTSRICLWVFVEDRRSVWRIFRNGCRLIGVDYAVIDRWLGASENEKNYAISFWNPEGWFVRPPVPWPRLWLLLFNTRWLRLAPNSFRSSARASAARRSSSCD